MTSVSSQQRKQQGHAARVSYTIPVPYVGYTAYLITHPSKPGLLLRDIDDVVIHQILSTRFPSEFSTWSKNYFGIPRQSDPTKRIVSSHPPVYEKRESARGSTSRGILRPRRTTPCIAVLVTKAYPTLYTKQWSIMQSIMFFVMFSLRNSKRAIIYPSTRCHPFLANHPTISWSSSQPLGSLTAPRIALVLVTIRLTEKLPWF